MFSFSFSNRMKWVVTTYIPARCRASLWSCPSSLYSPSHQRSSEEIKRQLLQISDIGPLEINHLNTQDKHKSKLQQSFCFKCDEDNCVSRFRLSHLWSTAKEMKSYCAPQKGFFGLCCYVIKQNSTMTIICRLSDPRAIVSHGPPVSDNFSKKPSVPYTQNPVAKCLIGWNSVRAQNDET